MLVEVVGIAPPYVTSMVAAYPSSSVVCCSIPTTIPPPPLERCRGCCLRVGVRRAGGVVGGYVGSVLSHLVYLGFGDPDQPHPVGCDLYITQWFMKKILPLDRRDGLLGTSVRIEGDQASVVIPS